MAVKQTIYWSVFEKGQLTLFIAATEKGLCFVGSPGQHYEDFEVSVKKRFPFAALERNDDKLRPYLQELSEYAEGRRREFNLPADLKGTPFQESVWAALREIPYGETVSYSDIALMIGKPSAVRAVGSAIGANPVLIAVPCHRVIGKSGAITGYRGGVEMKEYLLKLEGKFVTQ